MYENDKRIVLTIDAGGTNFVFSAIRGNLQIVSPVCMPSCSDNLDRCLATLVAGFDAVIKSLDTPPVAISFAFPGPADYKNGVIGGSLPNFPSFRQGVNRELEAKGHYRKYKNLLFITLGSGFGAVVVIDNRLLTGDNGCGGDVWLMRNKKYPSMLAEESVSIRAVKRVYRELSGVQDADLTPKDIYEIAEGIKEGDKKAAIASFQELGEMAGSAIASALNIVDGLVVIGG